MTDNARHVAADYLAAMTDDEAAQFITEARTASPTRPATIQDEWQAFVTERAAELASKPALTERDREASLTAEFETYIKDVFE